MHFFVWVRKNWINTLLGLVLLWLLAQRLPGWIDSYRAQGQSAPSLQVVAADYSKTTLPQTIGQPYIVIFWATWCGPCKLELSRYNKAVKESSLPGKSIYAVSIGENINTVKDFAQEQGYEFQIFADPENLSSQKYPVFATPTVVHVNKTGHISWVGTGISPLGVWRAKQFLTNP